MRVLVLTNAVLTGSQPAGAAVQGRWWRPAITRGAEFHLRASQSSGPADVMFTYGRPGGITLLGDWNGDGVRTPGVVRVVNDQFVWMLRNHLGGGPAEITFTFGRA